MTDEQLNQRFTQIAQAFEFLLQTSNKHAESIQTLERTVATLERTVATLAEVTRQHGEEILRISREWEAYLRTIRPQ
jgi:hypothetical protein